MVKRFHKGDVKSQSTIAKETKELLAKEPTELQKKIDSLKCTGLTPGLCIWGKHNTNFDNTKSLQAW